MGEDSQKNRKTLQPEDIVSIKGLGQTRISPDGRWAAFVQSSAILEADKSEHRGHIWLVETAGGDPFQLTNGPTREGDLAWSPDSAHLAFSSKRWGEKNQIWVIPIAGGEAKQLTHTHNGSANPCWSPDGKRMAFLQRDKLGEMEEARRKAKDDPVVVDRDDFKQKHLWVIDVKTMDEDPELLFTLDEKEQNTKKNRAKKDRSQRLTEGDFHVADPQWSPDGRQIAFVASPSPRLNDTMFNTTVRILDVERKEIRSLGGYKGGESAARWSPDGTQIAFLYSPEGYGQRDLYVMATEGGTPAKRTDAYDRNIDTPIWSPGGETIYFGGKDGTQRHFYAVPQEGGEIRQITRGDCVIAEISIADDGETFLCARSAPNAPGDVWTGSTHSGLLKQITKLNPQLDDFALGEVRVIKWQSSDGLEIEGLLCLPVGYEEDKKYPLIVEPHGGPHGGGKDLKFEPKWHYFSGEGFALFAPNFRGSDGYGRAFARSNFNDWGGGDYQDIMRGVDNLIETGIADGERLVVGGWSYGGFMTSWIVTQTDRFKAGMNGCGVTNLVSFYGQTDIPDFMQLYFKNAPPHQLELYRTHSPMNYVDRVKTPVLTLHGVEDRRVPLAQGEEFYACLKAVGVDAEFVKYPREGHGIGEPRHVLDVLKRQVAWYKKYLP